MAVLIELRAFWDPGGLKVREHWFALPQCKADPLSLLGPVLMILLLQFCVDPGPRIAAEKGGHDIGSTTATKTTPCQAWFSLFPTHLPPVFLPPFPILPTPASLPPLHWLTRVSVYSLAFDLWTWPLTAAGTKLSSTEWLVAFYNSQKDPYAARNLHSRGVRPE